MPANRQRSVIRTADGLAFGVPDLLDSQLRRLLRDPEALVRRHLDRPVKLDHGSLIVTAELDLVAQSVAVAFKRFRPRHWLKSVCWRFRRSRARRGWELAGLLLAHRVPTPRPLAMCEPRRGWFFRASYLATEWIAGAENLHLFGWRLATLPPAVRLRHAARCARSVGRTVGRMHAAGFANRDLKGANLLVVDDEDRPAAYLIDLDGIRVCRPRPGPRRRAADLARLAAGLEAHPWVSRTVCCRFLQAYAEQFPPGAVDRKALWRAVAARSQRLTRRKRRRGRPVW